MIDKLISFFNRPSSETKSQSPKGFCPNCWGEQEYDNNIRKMYADKQIDVNNHKANYAFVQDFVVNHVQGIKLRKVNKGFECPNCKTIFTKK